MLVSSKKIVQEAAKEDERVEQGKSVEYTCPYNGYPKPKFTWKKDDINSYRGEIKTLFTFLSVLRGHTPFCVFRRVPAAWQIHAARG